MTSTPIAKPLSYPVPKYIGLKLAIEISRDFHNGHKGKTRPLALWGALLDSIAAHFHA
jgi:hypothetical protein